MVDPPELDASSPVDAGDSAPPVQDAGSIQDAALIQDGAPSQDSAPTDAGPTADATPSMGTDCPAWEAADPAGLVQALHMSLHEAYRPVPPAIERCGDACRYVAARRMMFTQVERFADADGNFVVEGVYTGTRADQPDDMDPDRALINCEHTWPRSRMAPEDIDDTPTAMYSHQQADIHNLLPATPLANSTRGNFPFGEVVTPVNTLAPGVVLGEDADGNRVFQPRESRRGDVARVIFYFSIRWGGEIPAFEETTLRRWAAADPPDEYEASRNDAIERLQGNRNPFIDCPALVNRIEDFQSFEILDTEAGLGFP